MNIELQCCGLGMLAILLLIFIRQKSLNYSSRRKYFLALISCIICLTLDITSIIGIHLAYLGVISDFLAKLICKLYVLSLSFQAYQGFLYAASEFFKVGSHKKLQILYLLVFVIGGIAIMALPIGYFEEGRLVYSFGLSTYATYIVVLIFLASTILMGFMGGKRATRVRKYSILIWQGTWVLAAIFQFLFQGLLLVGFAAAFGMVLIYAELENPHEGIDRLTGQFTFNALTSYVNDLFDNNKTFSSCTYTINHDSKKKYDYESTRLVLVEVANILDANKNVFVFRNSDISYTVIYKDDNMAMKCYEEFLKKTKDTLDSSFRFSVLHVKNSSLFSSPDEYFRFLHYAESEFVNNEFTTADDETVGLMRKYFETVDLINEAIAEKRVVIYYQPIYNILKNKFTSAEALVRIIDKDGNIISPGAFIPVAEQSGLIVSLGREIFRQVCEFLSKEEVKKYGLDYVEVNLSAGQFDNDNPAAFVKDMINNYHIDTKMINLEITETAANSNRNILLKNMNSLLENGISFSLDDFGTGRSNLDYFVDMPVDIIKFDITFTHSYFVSEKARFVIESMVDLIRKMNLSIVAEGIETKEQLDAMSYLGIPYIQGYFFSKPLPQDRFVDFLKEHNVQ